MVVLTLTAGIAFAQDTATHDQWLVLTNGQTLQGLIQQTDGRYIVTTGSGSRIVMPARQVRFVAESLTDIYWDRLGRLDPLDASAHTSLFRWCLKNGLLAEAQKQIDLVASQTDLKDQASILARMSQELQVNVAQREKQQRLAAQRNAAELHITSLPPLPKSDLEVASLPSIPSWPIDAEGQPIRPSQTARATGESGLPTVGLVGFEEEIPDGPTKNRKRAWISNRQLDQETRSYPKGTVAFYRRHLEHHLIEHCSRCHDARAENMPMVRRASGQTIPGRMSQQNLHFVMQHVDRQQPLDSQLIRMALSAHGGQETAAFKESDPVIFETKKWAIAMSDAPGEWLEQLHLPPAENATTPQTTASQNQIEAYKDNDDKADPYDPAEFNRK